MTEATGIVAATKTKGGGGAPYCGEEEKCPDYYHLGWCRWYRLSKHRAEHKHQHQEPVTRLHHMIWDNTCTGANWNLSWTFKFATCWLLWFDQLLWDCLISFITFDYFGKDQLFSCVPWRPSLCFCALGKSISCILWHFLDFDQIGTIGAFLDLNIFNGTNFFQRWLCDLKTFKTEKVNSYEPR